MAPRQPEPTVLFRGWTNVAGKTHVVVLFPKLKEKSPKLWEKLCKSHYQLRVEFELMNKDGSSKRGFFEESGGNSPDIDTPLKFPVSEDTFRIRLISAESQMFRYWDDLDLPIPPPRPRWKFNLPTEWQSRLD